MHLAFVRHNSRRGITVRHRQDHGRNAKRAAHVICDFTERAPLSQLLGAIEVRCKIAVAQIEPLRLAVARNPGKRRKRIARDAPAGRFVYDSCQCVGDGVYVGRDSKSE